MVEVCDNVHDGISGSEVSGVFLASMMMVAFVGVMTFAVGLVLFMVFMMALACWWWFWWRWCAGGGSGRADNVGDHGVVHVAIVVAVVVGGGGGGGGKKCLASSPQI